MTLTVSLSVADCVTLLDVSSVTWVGVLAAFIRPTTLLSIGFGNCSAPVMATPNDTSKMTMVALFMLSDQLAFNNT